MSNSGYPYQETLLQWIWQELEFDTTSLQTTDGQPVEIIDPGTINNGAGPDFTGVSVRIGPLKLFGDVEIHIHPGHWAQHNHQASARFNRVVLHVVYDLGSPNAPSARRPDGTIPPILQLKPCLQKSLAHLFERKQNPACRAPDIFCFSIRMLLRRKSRKPTATISNIKPIFYSIDTTAAFPSQKHG
jgi:hypothetical protein